MYSSILIPKRIYLEKGPAFCTPGGIAFDYRARRQTAVSAWGSAWKEMPRLGEEEQGPDIPS